MSKLLTLNLTDVEKAIIVAIFTPVAAYLGQCLQAFASGGSFAIDPTLVWHLALAGFVGYLTKNVLTNSQGEFLGSEPAPQS